MRTILVALYLYFLLNDREQTLYVTVFFGVAWLIGRVLHHAHSWGTSTAKAVAEAPARLRLQRESARREAEAVRQAERNAALKFAEEQQRLRALRRAELLARREKLRAARAERKKPPPPTRAERLAALKARYDEILRALEAAGLSDAELAAAKEQAHQRYLMAVEVEMTR